MSALAHSSKSHDRGRGVYIHIRHSVKKGEGGGGSGVPVIRFMYMREKGNQCVIYPEEGEV